MSRSALIYLAATAALMFCTAGCPSAGDPADTPTDGETPAGQSPPPSPVELRPSETAPSAEPALGPIEPLPEDGGAQPSTNPLRQGGDSPLRDPTTVPVGAPPGDGTAETAPKETKEPFDPIKANGPIFVDWPKPKLALVITGRQDGYLEPCGCAGLDRMKGGMSRRYSLFGELRNQRGWPTVGIDVGGLAKGYGRQAELKFHITVEAMRKMGYSAINLGKAELRLPAGELVAEAASVDNRQSPFLSANVGLFGFAAELTAQTRIVEAGGMRLGITGILGNEYQKEINDTDVEMIDPETALARVVPELKQKADYLILLAHATKEESIALARKFPDFDLVVTAGGPPEPPAQAEPIEGTNGLLIEVGHKGMDAIVLGFVDGRQQPLYQRVPLDSRFPASAEMHGLMEMYQEQVKTLGFEGLGVRPVAHPLKETSGKFVGSKACAECHEISDIIWRKSKHSKAYATLVAASPPRNFDPECISCHVVGWHPTEYFPYQTGFESIEATPLLADTGCETCHGPCGAHVAAENGTDLALQEKYRLAARITKEESQDPRSGKEHCYSCHDLDNSPEFNFETYWPQIEHYEKKSAP